MSDRAAWLQWLQAPAGLVLVGAGLSVAIDAATRRQAASGGRRWVGQGTVGLVLLNSGLSVFGDAVRRRAATPQSGSSPVR